MIDVSIIVTGWNSIGVLIPCLESVFAQTRDVSFEVIYVDNASADDSVKAVRERFPEVKIIENAKNMGFIKANNIGIRIASGRYVLLLNSDTIILQDAIKKTVEFADKNPDVGVVGCKVLNRDGSLQRNCFMYHSNLNLLISLLYLNMVFPKSRIFGRKSMTWWDFDTVKDVEVVCGCYVLVRRKAFDVVGLMEELFHTYGDDVDWCYRFKAAGWRVMYTPCASIIHLGGQTTKQSVNAYTLQLYGSILLFMKRHRGRVSFVFSRLLVGLFMISRGIGRLGSTLYKNGWNHSGCNEGKIWLRGGMYAFSDWTKLLLNRQDVLCRLATPGRGYS